MGFEYEKLKKRYGGFRHPVLDITVEGKSFEKNRAGMVIGEARVELTSGFEASEAMFKIYGCVDPATGEFDFDSLKPYICLGSYVVMQMGYSGEKVEVFRGFIAQVQFGCEENESPGVEVTAMDVKGIMMANMYAKQMRSKSYSEAVKEIFQKQAYQNLSQKGMIEKLAVTDTPDHRQDTEEKGTDHTIEMVSESDYEFIVKAAKRFNYEFFSDAGTVYFRKAKQEQKVLIQLGLYEGILNYQVGYDIRGLVQKIETRSMDDGKGTLIAAQQTYKNKVSFGNKANALLSHTEKIYVDSTIRSRDEAAARAAFLMEQMSYRFGSLEAECIGIPELKPGHFVDMTGFGKPADNRFYITGVVHRLAENYGYRTRLTGRSASIEGRE